MSVAIEIEPKRGGSPIPASATPAVAFVESGVLCPEAAANSTNSTTPQIMPQLGQAIYPADSILADYMDYARGQEESADCYLLGSILPVASALLARSIWLPWGESKVYPNLFTVLAGKPGDRKSSAINAAERLAKAILPPNRFLSHNCSAEALFDEFHLESGGFPDKLLIADDANPILSTWTKAAYGQRVADRFLTLFDCKGMTESFRRNAKDNAGPRREIAETSTSLVFGVTFDNCQFKGKQIRSGFGRRFLYYVAEGHGRFIAHPPKPNPKAFQRIVTGFSRFLTVRTECSMGEDTTQMWSDYQRRNREELDQDHDEAKLARLNSAPRAVQKVALVFQAAIWAKSGQDEWDGIIQGSTLNLAIEHVAHCLWTADRLDVVANREAIRSAADSLLNHIRADFQYLAAGPEGRIVLTKSQLTSRYAPHSSRPNAWRPRDLYDRFIPDLIERDLARVEGKKGKMVEYAFLANGAVCSLVGSRTSPTQN